MPEDMPCPQSVPVADAAKWINAHIDFYEEAYAALSHTVPLTKWWSGCRMDSLALRHTMYSAHVDLGRLERGRSIEADVHKRTAYLTAWFMRFRPIQMPETTVYPEKYGDFPNFKRQTGVMNLYLPLLSNAYFCASLALRYLGITNDRRFWIHGVESASLADAEHGDNSSYMQSLVYHLHFHGVPSPRHFGHEMYLLDQCYIHWKRNNPKR